MENSYYNMLLNIANYFVKYENEEEKLENCRNITTLIRIHNEKLGHLGEASFPSKFEIWEKYFQTTKGLQLNEEAFKMINGRKEEYEHFLAEAQRWPLPVARLEMKQERCYLYLQRRSIIGNMIQQVLNDPDYGRLKKTGKLRVHVKPLQEYGLNDQDLSYHRSKLMHQTLQKLLLYSRYIVQEQKNDQDNFSPVLHVNVLSVGSKVPKDVEDSGTNIKCGLVTDPLTKGKICQLTTDEYLSLRSNDMCLMALHKYGIRVKQDASFCALMERLGCAAVTVDLLEVKHTSPVQIIRNGQGSTKGASFILYNSARLESILRSFQERIERCAYEPQPEMKDIDWSVINEEVSRKA